MTPSISEFDFRNHGLADSVMPCHLSLGDTDGSPDRRDVLRLQFGPRGHFSSKGSVSSLRNHVDAVVLVASCPEVGRIDAKPDIAGVAHAKPFGNGSIGKNPRESMSLPRFTVELEGSVSITVPTCDPEPALVRAASVYLLPEASGKINFSHDDLLSVVVVRGAESGTNPVRASSF